MNSLRYENARTRAKNLFVHYMSFTWRELGIQVDGDNVAEWEEIVDNIIEAAGHKMLLDKEQEYE